MSQLNVTGTQEETEEARLKLDTVFLAIKTKTPDQIENFIENNVTDLASAKTVLKLLAKAIVVLARKI